MSEKTSEARQKPLPACGADALLATGSQAAHHPRDSIFDRPKWVLSAFMASTGFTLIVAPPVEITTT